MIGSTRGVRVFAYAKAADLRRSYDGLFAIATEEMKRDVLAGDLFLFVNKRRNRAKVLLFDGTGMCIYMKWTRAASPLLGYEAPHTLN